MERSRPPSPLHLVALVGAGEAEIPVLAELHRNRAVHVVGVYDPDPNAVGHELAEILGLRHGHDPSFLEHVSSAQEVVLPRDRHRFADVIARLRSGGARFLNHDEALSLYTVDRLKEETPSRPAAADAELPLRSLEETLGWLGRALDREELLRALLSIGIQAAGADKGSIQLLDPSTRELYIAYAEGLSDHTIRSSRQKLGEGIAGQVAQRRKARLMRGGQPQGLRDRPDILSSLCVPLLAGGELLGVLNVSTDFGSRCLGESDLHTTVRIAERIAPVLRRLLEIQSLHDRTLVEELEREMDRLLQLDLDLVSSLGMVRDLLQDLSGASSASLVVLTPDGPAFRVLPGKGKDGRPRGARDLDASAGILGQVLLAGTPAVLEEKVRAAGERRIRRTLTLYMPLGQPEVFAVHIARFEGLAALSHFQRSMARVEEVLSPRLGTLLARDESAGRMERLRVLAAGLSHLSALPRGQRPHLCAELFLEQSRARAVAVWDGDAVEPTVLLQRAELENRPLQPLFRELRERMGVLPQGRLREADPEGSPLRSILVCGEPQGPALAAVGRRAEGPLDELGFRQEDLEAAAMLLGSFGGEAEASAPTGAVEQDTVEVEPVAEELGHETNRRLLLEALQRELRRAQRYHFGFSVSCFEFDMPDEAWSRVEASVREQVDRNSRSTDCVLWIGARRFAILAPEEARGQKRLSRRLRSLLDDLLAGALPEFSVRVGVGAASYPHDAEGAEALLALCESQLHTASD